MSNNPKERPEEQPPEQPQPSSPSNPTRIDENAPPGADPHEGD